MAHRPTAHPKVNLATVFKITEMISNRGTPIIKATKINPKLNSSNITKSLSISFILYISESVKVN